LTNIKFGDITFRSRYNPAHAEDIAKGKYASVYVVGKGRKGRTVFLHSRTVRLIKQRHLLRPYLMDAFLVEFLRLDGVRVVNQPNKLYKVIGDEGRRVLGRHVHTHMFRHSRATHLADKGADLLDIMAYLGHDNPATAKIYVEISVFRSARAFELFSEEL
jgi:integrase